MCYLLVSPLQLSFGPHCRLVTICNVVSCWRMARTCESTARLKTNSAQSAVMYSILCCQMARTRVNTTVLVPEGGWIKNCYLRGFIHVTIFNFLKNVNTSFFFTFIKARNRFKKCKKCCNLQGFGTKCYHHRGKNQRPKVANTLTVFRAFHVFLTFQKPCKYSTSIFCNQPAKNAVIYNVFLLGLPIQNTGICASLVKKVLVFTALSAFLHFSRKRR